MYFFVKSQVRPDRVDEFTDKLVKQEICGVEGNLSYVTRDGSTGYDIVECRDESDCRQKYDDLVRHGMRIDEMTPIEPLGQFIAARRER